MVDQRLWSFVSDRINKDESEKTIRDEAAKAGWRKEEINDAFMLVNGFELSEKDFDVMPVVRKRDLRARISAVAGTFASIILFLFVVGGEVLTYALACGVNSSCGMSTLRPLLTIGVPFASGILANIAMWKITLAASSDKKWQLVSSVSWIVFFGSVVLYMLMPVLYLKL